MHVLAFSVDQSLHALCFPTGQIDIPEVSLLRGDSTGFGLLRGKKVNVQ